MRRTMLGDIGPGAVAVTAGFITTNRLPLEQAVGYEAGGHHLLEGNGLFVVLERARKRATGHRGRGNEPEQEDPSETKHPNRGWEL
jgi:hypothetical protein